MKITNFFLSFVLALFLSIIIHEAGHLFFSTINGIPVDSFNIGFGNLLYTFDIGNLPINLRIIPLGGYVSIPDSFELYSVGFLEILLFSFGGIVFNLITAFLLFHFLTRGTNSSFLLLLKQAFIINRNYFENKFNSYFVLLFLFFSSLLAIINSLPFSPLDGSKVVSWIILNLFHSESFYEIYSFISFFFFVLVLIFFNATDSFRDRVLSFLFKKKLKGNDDFVYYFRHIKKLDFLEKLYEKNYFIFQENLKKFDNSSVNTEDFLIELSRQENTLNNMYSYYNDIVDNKLMKEYNLSSAELEELKNKGVENV